ncbi:NnrS family protein [Sulfitobacter mediterraneus]|uniref:NnrS family protein n=1 Tax=Sulfitobacter mediterraneus TaxID=83219 RepID=UPI00193A80C1|nr:NnrS family protein [Sulfitobacter mediterraneus]MBM1558114.1 NnrS family protein [Sulfitobacter mediterraneus]MBM1570226.1 NnrS family protein [Sulfitobacter mediterraneus]MBM1573320.1 NnrS family protein [Sulfitobacter mediterraneus]MBM1577244.1 NnrS family protein [Sulfitobacter mediterraneus]MBM1581103.1 NnrS family protein [Sulfitobacter mediterraneus]
MTDTTSQSRSPLAMFFSLGFRPFFLGAALWAVAVMALWLAQMFDVLVLPTGFDPVSWHAHAFLFGYLSAVIAGFLLTAVPNWTGRAALSGAPLIALFLLWILGRLAVLTAMWWPASLVIALDLGFLAAVLVWLLREIIAGQNWRNLIVVAMLLAFLGGNAVFHFEAAGGEYAAQGVGLRIGISAAVMMVAVIGGRIVPAFTRNWLVKQGSAVLPAPVMAGFDKIALLVLLAAMISWLVAPYMALTGGLLLLAGCLQLLRLGRWAGHLTLAEPLVVILHLGYAFVPLGAVAIGLGILGFGNGAAAQHLWMAGALGVMTLAVMTRASLGHSGRALISDPVTVVIYTAIVISVIFRWLAGNWPEQQGILHAVSGAAWVIAFGGFALSYGAMMIRPRADQS